MSQKNQDQSSYYKKFGITQLNPMQEEAAQVIGDKSDVVLLSPTGTGKTLAFLLPLIASLKKDIEEIQALILVPTRELAQQIEQVTRDLGTGYKINAVYGGRSGSLDKIELKTRPAILIGTPGRVADRLRRDSYTLDFIKTLVLDEFDKSLEVGFEKEMSEIAEILPKVRQRILTSATSDAKIPAFLGLNQPVFIDYLGEGVSQLTIKSIVSPYKDKLQTLGEALEVFGNEPGIVFCNFKDALERVSNYLIKLNISHGCYHGGMEQVDRERALIKFRNGTHQLLLATDLAARGIDIPEIKYIIHYHLPNKSKEFIHRNGRTARMNKEGVSYILKWEAEKEPDFVREINPEIVELDSFKKVENPSKEKWVTLYISGGRKDKISKGDIVGLFLKQGGLNKEQLGVIELKQTFAYVGVHKSVADKVISKTNNSRLKKKKVRISLI